MEFLVAMKKRQSTREKTILKGALAERLFRDVELPLKRDAAHAVDIIIKTMTEALVMGQRVEIRGFGSFSVRQRPAKVAKNPKTGAMMAIPVRKTPHFTMSKSLKQPLIDQQGEMSVVDKQPEVSLAVAKDLRGGTNQRNDA